MKKLLFLIAFLLSSFFGFSQANITVTNTDGSTIYVAGQNKVYAVTIANTGTVDAQNVVISATLTTGITIANVTWSGNNGTSGTGNLSTTLATLGSGTSVIYTVTVPVPSNFSQTTSLVHEVTAGTAVSTDTDTPNPIADIVTVKTNNQTQYLVGETTVYVITVQNLGPSDAINVIVNDAIPAGLNASQMSWSSSTGASGSGALTETIPFLQAGQTITYNVPVFIPQNYTGNFINQVIVSSGTPDPVVNCPTCIDVDLPRPKHVTIDSSTYSVTQLIKDVLINEPCVSLNNFTSSGASSFGAFKRNNSNFPFKEGIIIRSGIAALTQGMYTGTSDSSIGSGLPDADLNLINGNNLSNDRSFVKFNFIPTVENFSFNFLFASNEYGTYQCTFGDTFAFILTNLSTGVSKNLAVVPGTATETSNGTRVSVVTIRDAAYNAGCGSVNIAYFDRYNAAGTGPNAGPASSAINMIGQTVPMTAAADVTPGTEYSIKLVIADQSDTAFDSAVFLEAGSFVIGGPRITGTGIFDSNTEFTGDAAFCENSTQTIQAGTGPVTGVTYSWLKDGTLIAGATNYNIEVSEPGTYTVVFSYGNGCQQSDDIEVEFQPVDFPLMAEAVDLFVCNSTAPTFDLTLNEPIVMAAYTVSDFDTYYFTTLAAAQDPNPTLTALPNSVVTSFVGTEGQQIWMKMVNQFEGGYCNPIKTFKLYFTPPPSGTFAYPPDTDSTPAVYCFNSNSALAPVLTSLTPNGTYSVVLNNPADLLTIDTNTGVLNLTGATPGTYTIKYTIPATAGPDGCPEYNTETTIVIEACITATVSTDGNVCEGTATFKLLTDFTEIGGTTTYEWKDNDGAVFSTDKNPIDVPVPAAAGTYTYTLIITQNGTASDPYATQLIVHPLPVGSFITVPTTICTNTPITLAFSGTAGATIKFTDGTNLYQVILDTTGNGEFTTPPLTNNTTFTLQDVTGTTDPACEKDLNGAVLISVGLPSASIVKLTNTVICSGAGTGLEIQGTPGSTVTYTKDGVVQPTVVIGTGGTLTIPTGIQTVANTATFTYALTNVQSTSTPPCSDTISGQSAILTVNALPTATFSAVSTTICEGTEATLNFTGTANATVTYNNGTTDLTVLLDGAGFGTVQTGSLSATTTYTLVKVEVTNSVLCLNNLSGNVVITIDNNAAITTQPVGFTKCIGDSVTFSTVATGANLTYQWFFEGVAITNATTATYTIAPLTALNAGNYTVKVTGSCGATVTSVDATLTLTQETLIATQPAASTTLCVGQPLTLSVNATGTNIAYQWFRGTTSLAGATNSTFSIGAVSTTNAGDYTVVISNPCQTITSSIATVIVNELPVITTQPAGTTICEGQGISLNVVATGTNLTYQWFKDGVALAGATAATYADTAVALAEAGSYTVKVSGACAPAADSAAAVVIVNQGAAFTVQPEPSTIVCSGTQIILTVATTGGTGVTYQWFKGSTAISGATTTTYTITASTVADSGSYTCKVTVASCGTITSDAAVVVVNQAPAITSQPQSKEICVDQSTTFTVVATGTNLTYQWFKDAVAIAGETTNTYSVTNATQADSGDFYCIVTSTSCPDIQTVTVTLLVKPLPTATIAQGNPSTICAGESTQVIFNGTAGAVVSYTINGGTPETITLNAGIATILPTGTLTKTTVYELVSVTYTGPDACSQTLTGSATVTVNPLPKVVIEDGTICVDPITLATTRTYLLNTGLNEAEYTFEWFDVNGLIPLATNSFYEVSVIGQYGVTITDIITGCQASAYANVDQSLPPLDFDYTVSGFFADNPTVVITATPIGNYEYQLDFGPFQESNIFDNITAGTHTITVRDPEACDVLVKDVLVVDYPRYFTPNGDGINDTWNIPSIYGISLTKIYIFDRFGKLIKEMNVSGSGWDGTYNGKPLPGSDFWFTLNYQEAGINKEYRAHFSLKR